MAHLTCSSDAASADRIVDLAAVERELIEFDYQQQWGILFAQLKSDAVQLSQAAAATCDVARTTHNQLLNRYRDVAPYDHSRVRLKRTENDYINASFVEVPQARRRYILAQAPLLKTAGHFWLMVWEQDSPIIVMLNKVVEKCHPYFPIGPTQVPNQWGSVLEAALDRMDFPDVGLRVTLSFRRHLGYFVEREFLLEDIHNSKVNSSSSSSTAKVKKIKHFQYLMWPDFGVPKSPASFLNFLLALRNSGAIQQAGALPIIHCSAGIGRSGTLVLVDSGLLLIQEKKDMNCVNLRQLLLDMRRCRMGLIQTAEQLRFSYKAVVEGARELLAAKDERSIVFQIDPEEEDFSCSARMESQSVPIAGCSSTPSTSTPESNSLAQQLRRANKEEKLARTQAQIDLMRTKMRSLNNRHLRYKYLAYVALGFGLTLMLAAFAHWLLTGRSSSDESTESARYSEL